MNQLVLPSDGRVLATRELN